MKNIMSVDLEDHFCDLPYNTWKNYESRVVESTNYLLDVFEKFNVKATFFTLGYIVEKHPELILDIKNRGHEISSHGYFHRDLRKINKDSFEKELIKSLEIIKKITGEKVLGFRAPWFSINKKNLWVFEVLKKYLKYDSSIFPSNFHYGLGDAPKHIYKISDDDPLSHNSESEFFEIPMTTLKIPIIGNMPVSGGIYLRTLPIKLIKKGINEINNLGYPNIFYVHPQDFDHKRPHLEGLAWHNFLGLKKSKNKFQKILESFEFSTVKDVLKI